MDTFLPKRKNLRLQNFDYSRNNAYFVTVCVKPRRPIFGNITRPDSSVGATLAVARPDAEFHPSAIGQIAIDSVSYIENLYGVSIPVYMIMPDHIHMIVVLENRATARVAPTLGLVVGGYKSKIFTAWLNVCKEKNESVGQLWQRGYHEHIIRNQSDFNAAAEYIIHNPTRWLEKNHELP